LVLVSCVDTVVRLVSGPGLLISVDKKVCKSVNVFTFLLHDGQILVDSVGFSFSVFQTARKH
jgi:hypothetical protein